jgi:hypothetical protein
MLEILGLIEKTVQVGVNTMTGQKQRHGVATLATGRKLPFTVDHPERLKRPSTNAVSNIFDQFKRLSHPALSIEISVGNARKVYRMEDGTAVLVQKVSI